MTGYSTAEILGSVEGGVPTRELYKEDLPTPCLLLDLDAFESNVRRMHGFLTAAGQGIRPHAKTHKCPEVAKRQVAAGASGICVARIVEAEAMVRAGIPGILISSPVIGRNAVGRLIRLVKTRPDLMVVVDHPRGAADLADAAEVAGVVLNVVVDLDVGLKRTGALPGEGAAELTESILKRKSLRFSGLQAFAGCTHVQGFEKRRGVSLDMMGKAVRTRELLESRGIEVPMLSGGSTGTYNIDSELAGVTEQQVGSYVFMDVDYRAIGGRDRPVFDDFQPALWVLTTVVSRTYSEQATVDAGLKAFATDRPYVPEVKGLSGVRYGFGGDEHGRLFLEHPSREVELGDRLELMVTHCDPNVNLFEQMFCTRGERVEAVWTVEARGRG